MSKGIAIIGLPVQVQSVEQVVFAPNAQGIATVNGRSIRSLSHLPGEIVVIEHAEGLVIIPWALFNQLLRQAASQNHIERGVA